MSQVLLCPATWRPLVALLAGGAFVLACTQEAPKKKRSPTNCQIEDCYSDLPVETWDPLEPDRVDQNSGAFGPGERPSGTSSGPSTTPDAGPDDDAGPPPKVSCGSVVAGDLAIVELMISSKSGSGDWGEWIEIQNTRDCWLELQGLSIESPRGSGTPNVASITVPIDLEPHGTFVVASSKDPAKNNGIPGIVVEWNASDVLKNDGDTITIKKGNDVIDSLTYPRFTNLTPGRAVAFPADCTWADRSSWTRWSLAFDEFSPGYKGTPNAPNADVTCF
jgi:hypothetical protein